MKDFIENLLRKYNNCSVFLIIYLVSYFILTSLSNNVPILDNFCRILINPVVFFGVPALFLKHARYKELLKIHKNYTTEEFLAAYDLVYNRFNKNFFVLRDGKHYNNEELLEKLYPLSIDLLCIDNYSDWQLKDWIKEGKSIEDFIKKEYKETYCNFEKFWLYIFVGIYIQLLLWGII